MEKYLIYGAGGHARVLHDLLLAIYGENRVTGFFNDAPEPHEVKGIPAFNYHENHQKEYPLIFGIGSSKVRKILAEKIKHQFTTLIHPKAIVAKDVEIGEGTVVLAGAVIQTGARIGKHVIINANVTVDHDAVVGDFVTTYPGVYLGAECHIADGTVINPNAVIMRFMKTDAYSEVASGMVII